MFARRAGLARPVLILIVVLIIAAVAGAVTFLGKMSSNSGTTIDLSLIESDPVTQQDSLNPMNITVMHDTTVTLAIQNGDDEARTFEISAFAINETISSGATERVTFAVGQAGVFEIYVPPEPPIAGYRASPAVTGYIIVT